MTLSISTMFQDRPDDQEQLINTKWTPKVFCMFFALVWHFVLFLVCFFVLVFCLWGVCFVCQREKQEVEWVKRLGGSEKSWGKEYEQKYMKKIKAIAISEKAG